MGEGELAVGYRWQGAARGLAFSAYFHGDPLGTFSLPVAPAGEGALQRHTATVEKGWTVSRWEDLLDVEVAAGEVVRVPLP